MKSLYKMLCFGWGMIAGGLLCGCEKELDFKYNDIPALPVIEGVLSSDGIKVSITETTPMDEAMDRTRYTDAEVVLRDITVDEILVLKPDTADYFTAPYKGIPGHSYSLEVRRGANQYQMSTEMFAPTDINDVSFSWIRMPYDDVAVLQVKYADLSENRGDYYWVRIYRNGEIYMWRAQSDVLDGNGEMIFFAMTTRRNTDEEDEKTVLNDGDIITVEVTPISKAMFEYLEALENDSSGPRLFSAVPEVPGCLGYFMASTSVFSSVVFHPDEIPYAD